MKAYRRAIIALLSILMTCAAACGGSSGAPTPTPEPEIHRPTVNSLPEGWHLTMEVNYGQVSIPDEPKMGFFRYAPAGNDALLYIQYGDIPGWAQDIKDDPAVLLEELIIRSNTSCSGGGGYTPDEIGLMTFCDVPAAYARFSLPDQSIYGIVVLCVNGPAMIYVDAVWWATDEENDVMSIIDNISY